MDFNNKFHLFFFILIFFTGVLTSFSDLKHQKIRNNCLFAIAVAALVLTIFQGASEQSMPNLKLTSTGCAMVIAWVFYINDLWRGGDAKLFVLYAFLMFATGYEERFLLPCIVLFINTFIFALMFIILDLIKTAKWQHILDSLKPQNFLQVFWVTAASTWLIFPLFSASGLSNHNVWSFTIFYVVTHIFRRRFRELCEIKYFPIFVLIGGFGLRYVFMPEFFVAESILVYLKMLILYFIFAYTVHELTVTLKGSQHRVPFAPFLFLGCLLSFTPFLQWMMTCRLLWQSILK